MVDGRYNRAGILRSQTTVLFLRLDTGTLEEATTDERTAKSLKLYINHYRQRQISHEAATNTILNDLLALLAPRWMRVVADFNVRGNIKTIIFAEHTTSDYQGPRPEYRRYLPGVGL